MLGLTLLPYLPFGLWSNLAGGSWWRLSQALWSYGHSANGLGICPVTHLLITIYDFTQVVENKEDLLRAEPGSMEIAWLFSA